MKVIYFVLILFLAIPAFGENEEGADGTAPPSSESPPPSNYESEAQTNPQLKGAGESIPVTKDEKLEKEEKAPRAESLPLISNPPKRLSSPQSKSGESSRAKGGGEKAKAKQSKKKKAKAKDSKGDAKGQWAVVQTDGAAAYKVPNFDSPVLEYLESGRKVRISQKIFQGIGGFGAFYKVKISEKIFGYIADVDVVSEHKAKSSGRSIAAIQKNPFSRSPQAEDLDQVPIFFTRYMGGILGSVNYAEKFSGNRLSSSEMIFGFRLSGPGALVDGLPLDFSLLFHSGAPTYYSERIAEGNPSGFFVISDIFMPYPFLQTSNTLVSWGLGLMGTYTRFNLLVKNTIFDSQEARIGLAAQLGFTYRFGKFAVRLEAKYYYEKTDYAGYFATLMRKY
jgi:hypothetical protein